VITLYPKSRLRFGEYRFYPIRSGILLIISYGILLQMISYIIASYSHPGCDLQYIWSISIQ